MHGPEVVMDSLTKELETSTFFKSLEEFEENKTLPLQGYEKVVSREFNKLLMLYWINGRSKENLEAYFDSKEWSKTEKEKLVAFLETKDSEFRYKNIKDVCPEAWLEGLVERKFVQLASNISLQALMTFIESSIAIKAERVKNYDLSAIWQNIIESQKDENDCLDIGEALDTLRHEIMPDLGIFLSIRPALGKMKQGSLSMMQFARNLELFSSKIGRFCKFFNGGQWAPNNMDVYSSFVAGLQAEQSQFFNSRVILQACTKYGKPPIEISWGEVVETIRSFPQQSMLTYSVQALNFVQGKPKKDSSGNRGKRLKYVPTGLSSADMQKYGNNRCLLCLKSGHKHYQCDKYHPGFKGSFEMDHPYYGGIPEKTREMLDFNYKIKNEKNT